MTCSIVATMIQLLGVNQSNQMTFLVRAEEEEEAMVAVVELQDVGAGIRESL